MKEIIPERPQSTIGISHNIEVPVQIETALELVRKRLASFSLADFRVKELYDPATHLLHGGGKLIRGALVLSSATALGIEPEKFVDLAVGIELIHHASLIHDDFIDGDIVRRGLPTVHVKFGPELAVLGGDGNIARGVKYTNRYGERVVDAATEAAMDMAAGEALDFTIQKGSEQPELEDYLEMIRLKTASLMEIAASAPAIYVGDAASEKSLRAIGHNMGMSFQLRDDILEYLGLEDRPEVDTKAPTLRPNIVSVFEHHKKQDPLKTAIKLNDFHIGEAREQLQALQDQKLFDGYLSFLQIDKSGA